MEFANWGNSLWCALFRSMTAIWFAAETPKLTLQDTSRLPHPFDMVQPIELPHPFDMVQPIKLAHPFDMVQQVKLAHRYPLDTVQLAIVV